MVQKSDQFGMSRRTAILSAAALGATGAANAVLAPAAGARDASTGRAIRVEFKNSRDLTVVGNLRRSHSRRLIVMMHGWQGNKSSKGRFDYLGTELARAGFATLAIDATGCGESDDGIITMDHGVDDVASAVRWAATRGYKQFGLYGNSWGSQVCIRAFDDNIDAIAVSGALTGPMHYRWSDYYRADQLAELAETGTMTVPDPEPIWRKTQVLSQESLDDYANIDQSTSLQRITAPMLILHGNAEWEEQALLKHSRNGIQYLPEGSRIAIFDGNPHSLSGYLNLGGALLAQWFEDHFEGR